MTQRVQSTDFLRDTIKHDIWRHDVTRWMGHSYGATLACLRAEAIFTAQVKVLPVCGSSVPLFPFAGTENC